MGPYAPESTVSFECCLHGYHVCGSGIQTGAKYWDLFVSGGIGAIMYAMAVFEVSTFSRKTHVSV